MQSHSLLIFRVLGMHAQHLRHQYLAALGIGSWLPRGVLPGAAKSESWVAEFVYNADEAVNSAQPTQHFEKVKHSAENSHIPPVSNAVGQAKSLSASLQSPAVKVDEISQKAANMAHEVVTHLPAVVDPELNQPPVEREAIPSTIQTKAAAADVAAPITEMPRHAALLNRSGKPAPVMRLMFWQFPDLLVIDSLPTHTRGTLTSQKYEQLLSNMIKAMQLDCQRLDSSTQPYVLNWPTLAGVSIDQGWDQAVSAVQHKLSKLLHVHTPKIVLMLGEPAAQMVMNVEEDFAAMRGMVFSLRSDIQAIASHSLTEMLNIPGCKRDVWQDLQKVLAL